MYQYWSLRGCFPYMGLNVPPLAFLHHQTKPLQGQGLSFIFVSSAATPHALPIGALGGWCAGGWVSEQTKVGLRLAPCGTRFGGQDLGEGGPECWLVGLEECGPIGIFSAPQVPQSPEANRFSPGFPVPELLTC